MSNRIVRDVDLIWTTTKVCGFNCEFCCVNARHVYRDKDRVIISCPASGEKEATRFQHGAGDIYVQAVRHFQETGRELDWNGQMRVLQNLGGYRAKLDITGGDCLLDPRTPQLVQEAARRLGTENVTLTATGMKRCDPAVLVGYVSEVNITVDQPLSSTIKGIRPQRYAWTNLSWAQECVKARLRVRAECPLTTANCNERTIEAIYRELCKVGVHTFLLMRLFTVGRGVRYPDSVPDPGNYRTAIAVARRLERDLAGPHVKVQCALRSLDTPEARSKHCDAATKSFGIMADGTLLASPWALDAYGQPLGDEWVLGNLARQPLSEILASEKAKTFYARSSENFHHCKICAFQRSQLPSATDRIFDRTDDVALAASHDMACEIATA